MGSVKYVVHNKTNFELMDESGYYEAVRHMKLGLSRQDEGLANRNLWDMIDSWEAKFDYKYAKQTKNNELAPWDKSAETMEKEQVDVRPPWDPQVEEKPSVIPSRAKDSNRDSTDVLTNESRHDWRQDWYDPRDRDRKVSRFRDNLRPSAKTEVNKGDPDAQDELSQVKKVRQWWMRLQERVRAGMDKAGLAVEEALKGPDRTEGKWETGEDGKRRKKVTASNYTAMEIHGFFGLIDDGSCSQGRMLICHIPQWVRGRIVDVRDGDQVRVWHVSGKMGGPLTVLSTGRHRYYSPGQKVTTWTICVPEEQWGKFRQGQEE